MSSEIVPFVDGSDTIPSAEPQPDCTGEEGKPPVVVSGGNHDMRNMSTENVPFVDGSKTIPSAEPDCTKAAVVVSGDSDVILRKRFGIRYSDLRTVEDPKIEFDLIGENHEVSYNLSPKKGPKCATQLNPTPDFVIPLLDKVKEPSVLLLRGCHLLFLRMTSPFPFEKFKTLISLEISGCTHFNTLPVNPISEMTQLQSLNLSYLPIQQFPAGDFLSNHTKLRYLVLKGCSNLLSLPKLPQLTALEYLELSYLLIETLPKGFFSGLERVKTLNLSGCSKLCSLPSIMPLISLGVLDLSHCTALQRTERVDNLWMFNLSYTALHFSSTLGDFSHVTHLFLRDAKVIDFGGLKLFRLTVLDVSGAQNMKDLDVLKDSKRLVALDLSRTGIESIDFISGMVNLRFLKLRECTRLRKLPAMEELTQLEVLDISRTLVEEVKLKGVPEGLQTSPGSGEIDFIEDHSRGFEGGLSKPDEIFIVSTFFSDSEFDKFRQRFRQRYDEIVGLISNFQENLKPTSSLDTTPNTSSVMTDANNSPTTNVASYHLSSQTVTEYRRMLADLEYIRDNIGLLENCRNCIIAEELLRNFRILSAFPLDLTKFAKVLRVVAKLKLIVPRKPVLQKKKNKDMPERRNNMEQRDVPEIDINRPDMQNLSRSYESLSDIHKKCLLYFTIFPYPYHSANTWIKERTLIHLWYGEGYIDLQREENIVARSKADSTTNPNPEITSISTEAGQTRNDANTLQVSTSIEEIGRGILMALKKEKFIIRYKSFARPEPRMWAMDIPAHSFVRARAKEVRFFEFDEENGKLTPHLTCGSRRACLVLSQDNLPSSCRLWAKHISSSKELAKFEKVRALLNVNEVMVDIRAEWFSKMSNLSVLQLSRWYLYRRQTTEVKDLKFLEELKNMKRLWVLSFEGFSNIKKLPDSICKVTSLKILNLRECSYLEELPVDIGSLKNLTHLDLTDCRILSNLPKGISLLSELEVLKGFVITYQIGGQQHRNACTLRELLKLEKLRKLGLVVHTDKFPDSQDLHVFNGMKNLCNLKITWQQNYNDLGTQPQPQGVVVGQKASSECFRWLPLKCWKQQSTSQDVDTEELLGSNLKKLELHCFPLETPPNWLHPSGLQKLEKLHILGGKLTTLLGDTNQDTWNVKTLVLTFLPNICMDWEELRCNFPHMTYLKARECDLLSSFPFVDGDLWLKREEDKRLQN